MLKVKVDKNGRRKLPDWQRGMARDGWVEGLDKLAPFASVAWYSDIVYTTPQLRGDNNDAPRIYFYDGAFYNLGYGNAVTCLGCFMDRLEGEELEQFEQNLPQIIEVLERAGKL